MNYKKLSKITDSVITDSIVRISANDLYEFFTHCSYIRDEKARHGFTKSPVKRFSSIPLNIQVTTVGNPRITAYTRNWSVQEFFEPYVPADDENFFKVLKDPSQDPTEVIQNTLKAQKNKFISFVKKLEAEMKEQGLEGKAEYITDSESITQEACVDSKDSRTPYHPVDEMKEF